MKIYRFVPLALVFACLAFSCKSSEPAVADSSAPVNQNVPAWLNDVPPEDVLWGIGSAKLSTDQLSMFMADSRARADLARQISTAAKGMVTDYAQDAGTVGSTSNIQLAETVSQQVAKAELKGASPIKREKAADGTWWYLVQLKKSDAAQVAVSSFTSEAADFANYKAEEALKRMNAILDNTPSEPDRTGTAGK